MTQTSASRKAKADKPTIEKPANKPQIGKDHIELKRIRLDLCLTQAVFANELDLKVPTLISYEQGRTKTIPENIMARARAVRVANGQTVKLYKRVGQMMMADHLRKWAHELGVDYDEEPQTLALLVGTLPSTISRWKSDAVMPSRAVIAAHRAIVKINATRLRRAKIAIDNDLVLSQNKQSKKKQE